MSSISFTTGRLLLTEITDDDTDHIRKGLSDPEVTRYYGVHFESEKDVQIQMKWYRNLREMDTGIWWKIQDRDSGEFLGACGFNDWDREENESVEIGCWLLPEHWGEGYATEALTEISAYAFRNMDIKRVNGFVEPENTAVKKTLKKLGFEYERTIRDLYPHTIKWQKLEVFVLSGKAFAQHKTKAAT